MVSVEQLTPALADIALDGRVAPLRPSPDGTVALVVVPLAAEAGTEQPQTVQAVRATSGRSWTSRPRASSPR